MKKESDPIESTVLKAKIYSQNKITLGKKLMEHYNLKEGDEILLFIDTIVNTSKQIDIAIMKTIISKEEIKLKKEGFKIKETYENKDNVEIVTEKDGKIVHRTSIFK